MVCVYVVNFMNVMSFAEIFDVPLTSQFSGLPVTVFDLAVQFFEIFVVPLTAVDMALVMFGVSFIINSLYQYLNHFQGNFCIDLSIVIHAAAFN